jgi:hypothetical protein
MAFLRMLREASMADISSTAAIEKPDPPSKAREWLTSATLILFTAAVGIACVIALSSTLTQTRMSTLVIDGVPLSIWKLDDIRTQWTEVRKAIDDLSKAISVAEKERAGIVGEEANANQSFNAKRTILVIKIDELLFRLNGIDKALAGKVDFRRDAKEGDPGISPAQQYGQLTALREQVLKDYAGLASMFDELAASYKAYGDAREVRLVATASREAMIQRIKGLQDAVSGSRTSLETLYRQINPKFGPPAAASKAGETNASRLVELDDATRARIENALYELQTGVLGPIINRMVTTQPDILTLTLVILMGVLGSSLQMTHAFFKQHRIEKVGAYLLRICVGAITALVIFIVAKAGVPVIADATRLGGDASINPYFVSFLAIISGLMSENAILSVQNQGAKFFGADMPAEPSRWAREDLRGVFKTQTRDPDRVKRLVQAKDEDFEGWVSGTRPIPANIQMIIAGVLQTPPRDLFTDIPPDQAGTTS